MSTLVNAHASISKDVITKIEPSTSIPFPTTLGSSSNNGMVLGGVGVRKYAAFVKVYAVGAYFDKKAMLDVIKKGNKNDIEKALLDPTYPRTIRMVMNRGLSADTFVNGCIKSVEPKLKGTKQVTVATFDKFKSLFPKTDLSEFDEFEFFISGDILLITSGSSSGRRVVDGGNRSMQSRPFTEALCDCYFGKDTVSPTLKKDVLKGIMKL